MKNLALNYPFATGFAIFLVIFIGGTIAGFILGIFIAGRPCEPSSPSDPCDGNSMAAGFIWSLSFLASLIAGIIIGISSTVFLKLKKP
jgi:hypothetical protein